MAKSIISVENLRIRVGADKILLENASFSLEPGEWVGLCGPSGSGKSRLLSAILGFSEAESGEIVLEGRRPASAHHPPHLDYYTPLAAVFQESALLDELTVRENLLLAGATPERADVLLRRALLDPGADGEKLPSALSGGMARRVALARALARTPHVLILDEPLAGVDPKTRDLLVEWLRELRTEHPEMAAIVVAHEIDVLTGLCDRALVLRPHERALRDVNLSVPEEEQRRRLLGAELNESTMGTEKTSPSPTPSLVAELHAQLRDVSLAVWEGVLLAPRLLASLPSGLAHPRFVEFFLRYGFLSLPFILIVNLIIGLSLVIQTEAILLPLRQTQRIPEAMAAAVIEGFGPLLVGLLMAGRAGSSQCGEIGMKRLARQWEALWLVGRDADAELFAPRAMGLVLAMPVLVLAGLGAALFSGALYFRVFSSSSLTGTFYLSDLAQQITFTGVAAGLLKGLCFGLGIAFCAYIVGRRPANSSEEVAQSSTLATTLAAAAVILIDFVISLVQL